ncbi:DivIVA domain-containing protein [Nesterenkonia xinjiangensis]|uniref:Cell wall synthesis protein Wag31 n=1 Tax=Nesterenkonia xinjiangensis TaxID=225327 RepID=A0A7Z0KAU0_9MICC|nr:DivIVA domain-containing protein [Nesterenkonia xinjiangensis]NYJ79263.1 DivIVA domain-containing protein [Nesterenkonia xinjiangensis]
MALTPDDLLNKEFPETKFRPGYEKDAVDDFLDDVVVEFRRLIQENEDLKAQVAALEEQIEENPANLEPDELNDAGLSGYAGTAAEVTGTFSPVTEDPEDEGGDDDATESVPEETAAEVSSPEDEAEDISSVTAYPEYPLGTRPAQPAPEAPAAASSQEGGENADGVASTATGVLAMAQKLHDQYVAEGEQTRAAYIAEGEQTRAAYIAEGEQTRTAHITEGEQTRTAYIAEGEQTRAAYIAEGETTRDQYIAEGEKTRAEYIAEAERRRAEIVTEAETRAENMIEEAELTSSRTLSVLERKKADLETKVSELTSFERDYRARLKDYIEGQLTDLNSRGSIEKEATGTEL